MLTGENGILTQAQNVKNETKENEAKEEVYLYWNEAQINYEDTIEEKVKLLEERMQEKDKEAKAEIQEENILAYYKGYNVLIPYNDSEAEEKINYFAYLNEEIGLYITKNSEVYVYSSSKKICLNDKFPELSNQTNLKPIGSGTNGEEKYILLISNKSIFNLKYNTSGEAFLNIENYTLDTVVDLNNVSQGKYKNNNIVSFLRINIIR